MSTRIIVEKDGERYACDGLTIDIQNKSILYVSDGTANAMASYVTLPHVIRTDNSEVIVRLEDKLKTEIETSRIAIQSAQARFEEELEALRAENAKLREALNPFVSLSDWLLKNAAHLGILDMVAKLREHGDRARDIMKGGAE